MKQLYALLCLLTLFAASPNQSARSATDEEAVHKRLNQFVETWNRHDVDGFSALFSEDATFVIITAQVWKGRKMIHDHTAFLHGTIPAESGKVTLPPQGYGVFKTVTYRFDKVEVKFPNKDIAVALVSWTQLGDPRFQDKPRQGTLTFVAHRQDDSWIFNTAHNTQRP